jgi:histidinol-phosphate aminotransferase
MTVSLAMNESRFGASRFARAAAVRAARDAHLYPDVTYGLLREALGRHHGLNPDCIVVGNGSEELIELIVRAFAPPRSEIVVPRFSYLLFGLVAERVGARKVVAPDRDLGADVDRLIEAVTGRTRLVMVAQPNNPTGVGLPPDELLRLARALPAEVWLVVDAAYAEYLSDHERAALLAALAARERAMMLRTFSKAYGLAGLRIGWLFGPAQASARVENIRNLSNVNRIAAAAAVAALGDKEFVESVRRRNARQRLRLTEGLVSLGISVTASAASFVAANFGSPNRALLAHQSLLEGGYRVRPLSDYALPNHLRIGVGTAGDVDAVIRLLNPVAQRSALAE